jgi:hypothetical protein
MTEILFETEWIKCETNRQPVGYEIETYILHLEGRICLEIKGRSVTLPLFVVLGKRVSSRTSQELSTCL